MCPVFNVKFFGISVTPALDPNERCNAEPIVNISLLVSVIGAAFYLSLKLFLVILS